jgi:hypothetical protein
VCHTALGTHTGTEPDSVDQVLPVYIPRAVDGLDYWFSDPLSTMRLATFKMAGRMSRTKQSLAYPFLS